MVLTSHLVLLAVVTVAFFVGLLSTAPTSDDDDFDYGNLFGNPFEDPEPVTTTLPAPENELTLCEKELFKNAKSEINPIKNPIELLMKEYNNWGQLLAPAPAAISILGQLILMANSVKDFPIEDTMKKNTTSKHIKYPNSFRTTLLQISQSGSKAFLTAHRNMDAIRMHNGALPSVIKDAVSYLMSTNKRVINLRLRSALARINDVIEKSEKYSKEVVKEFELVMELIDETRLAISNTKSAQETGLTEVIIDIQINNQSKVFSENETLILMEKDHKLMKMLDKLEHRKENIPITTEYVKPKRCIFARASPPVKFTINLANDWFQEIGQVRYKEDGDFLKYKGNVQKSTYTKQFIDSNPCAQNNSQQLLDLLIAFGQYQERYKYWKDSTSTNSFNGSEIVETFRSIHRNLQTENCTEIQNFANRINLLIEKFHSVFQSIRKADSLPFKDEISDITRSVQSLRTAANEVKEGSNKTQIVEATSTWEIYGKVKQHQLDQLNSMSKTVQDIAKLNNDLLTYRKRETEKILNKLTDLNITKVSTENAIQILKEGLIEMGELKNHWGQLIEFFAKIRSFIQEASQHSAGLIQIVEVMSENSSMGMKDKLLVTELRDNYEKSNEAALLVHGIAEMYVNVSNLYIKDRINRLNTMNSMTITDTTDEELKREKNKLINDAQEASQGIINYIKGHENELNKQLQTRHKEVIREFRSMRLCLKKHGVVDIAVNFTKADEWFKIQFRKNNKVLVSSENQIQMKDSNHEDNQLWYLDQENIIRSVITDFCLTSNDLTKDVTMEPCKENAINQKWTLRDDKILNTVNPNRCLVIRYRKQFNATLVDVDLTKETTQLGIWVKIF